MEANQDSQKNKTQTLHEKNMSSKEEPEGVRLDMGDISDSGESIIQVEDDKSEYKRSQTFIQEIDLGHIPKEFKAKIQELHKIAKSKDQGSTEPKENEFSLLPSLGKGIYGLSVK